MTTKRALILAGGGLAGIGWETGILQGIADEAPDTARALLDSDVLVGTSAGSTVAAQISSPLSLTELFERQIGDTSAELDSGADFDAITALFLSALSQPGDLRERLQRIGTIALNAPTVPESARRADRKGSRAPPAAREHPVAHPGEAIIRVGSVRAEHTEKSWHIVLSRDRIPAGSCPSRRKAMYPNRSPRTSWAARSIPSGLELTTQVFGGLLSALEQPLVTRRGANLQ